MAEEKSGLVFTVPVDNRPIFPSAVVRPAPSPVYAEDQEVVRTNVLLKSGTTVNVDDYDEEIHGPKVEEDDEAYRTRMMSAPNGRVAGTRHARTTIANLHTYDSTQVTAAPVLPTPPPMLNPLAAGKPVVTSDEDNPNLHSAFGGQTEEAALDQQQAALANQQASIDQQRQRIEERKKQREQGEKQRQTAQKRAAKQEDKKE